MTEQIHDIGRRRAWVIWLVALSVYVLAVFHRSSLGVAGLLAADRFDIDATMLSFFTVLQLVVYAGMQVPVGVLLDRFGSRAMLLSGLVLMTGAQLAFAFVESFPAAVAARAVVGAGDAMIFVSVIRLVASWFLVRQAPLVTQLTGQVGQVGAILAAAPLSWALVTLGWTRAFALASSLGVVLMVAVVLVVKNSPYARGGPTTIKLRQLARQVQTVWGNPGTKLGMWTHFTSQFSMTVFAMLWGFPFLVSAQGLSESTASTLLMLMTVWVIISGLVLSWLVSHRPYYRSWIVLGVVFMMIVPWTAVLLRDTPSPLWLLVVLVCLTATGGPASMVGFDLARSFVPVESSGRANGLVNIGGFSASLLTMALVGVVLDLREPGGMGAYDLDDYRAAMSVQYVFWALGIVQVLRYRRRGIAHLHRVHPGAVESMRRGEPFVHPGFSDREGV
ncbi:MFS transporter [Nocardioides euryhalodurans]|uniref:MFS transporter n=1 Tax=Nocardioides euryhalodurans TaxID=2518370 RepID=A0A4P7GK86_9ACTN|nr:MFS transporter [Nocardioides euryhalodurans]QBR92468.1 MFS transporter [Nocardioides euryhalodurans]